MTVDWNKVRFFKPSEFQHPEQLDPLLIYSIDALRDAAGRSIKINSDYRPGDPGQHGLGRAVDIVISGLHVVDQFLLAEKTRLFAGIGIYPHWNRPGIHVDIRTLQPHEPGARWARDIAGNYVALTWAFMRGLK